MKIMKILEFQMRINKNYENPRIPRENNENHEHLRIPWEKHENYENHVIAHENL